MFYWFVVHCDPILLAISYLTLQVKTDWAGRYVHWTLIIIHNSLKSVSIFGVFVFVIVVVIVIVIVIVILQCILPCSESEYSSLDKCLQICVSKRYSSNLSLSAADTHAHFKRNKLMFYWCLTPITNNERCRLNTCCIPTLRWFPSISLKFWSKFHSMLFPHNVQPKTQVGRIWVRSA